MRAIRSRAIRSTVIIGVALLLAVFLQPPTSEGQAPPPPTSTDFEYDILPGIQQANRLSNGWHELQTARGGWTDWLALDFVAEAQSPPDAPDVHEVLPGIQPGYDGPLTSEEAARRYFVSTDIRMTCGWHATCAYYIDADGNQRPPLPDYGIDMAYLTAGEVAGKTVWAALQAVDVSGGDLSAKVLSVHRPGDGRDCMSVEVGVYASDTTRPMAVLRYSHTIPDIARDDLVALADIAGEIAMTPVGRVARPNDENGVVDLDEDGIGCKTFGAHLHQSRGRGSDVSWLQRNRLSGAIPRALGAPGTLASLDLSHNQLSGAIPEQLGALQDLWFLSLEGNELTGAIPATLGALSSLGRLRLSDNQLSGAIPASLGDLSALWMLRLNGNALTGPVPASLGALPTLWELRLDDNQLRGAIAQALGSASNLRLLYLDGNAGLTGCIPAALRTVRHSDLADLGLADCADPAPLTLTLSGGREQCTAGTLSRAGWSIAGGVAPYTLTVAGEAVDADDVGVDVTCGALPEDGSETPGTITALVTDATGATTTASAAYTIVAPLPAPTGIVAYAQRTSIGIDWKRAAAAGPVPVFADCPCPLYLRRWRVAGTDVWSTALTRDRTSSSGQTLAGSSHYSLREGTTYEFQIATLRDEIEQETPEALVWSAPVTATTIAPATGVRAVATHDTVTVTWDPQPAARAFWVSVDGPRGRGGDSASFSADGDAPHRVVFRHLPPGAKWVARVTVAAGAYDSPRTETAARTSAPPPDWTPLPRGPQNVRTSVTHDSVTLRWDPPYPEAHNYYSVWLHPRTERIGPYTESSQRGSASGGVTEHTFRGLGSDSTYEISVSHAGVVFTEVEMTVTTAPWLPPPAATPVLPYKRFDRTGRALSPGSYAFLDGAGQAVTTYEALRDGTVTGLRIHQVDADGTSRADSFGAAAVGDVFEWRQAEDCWVRYQVTSLLPDPAGSAPRKRFAISWVTYAGTGCSGAVAPYTVVRVQWHPTPIVSGSITSPVHDGPYVLHPPDWEGELPEEVTITLPEPPEGAPPTRSDDDSLWPSRDLTVVRQHPLWREPDLPEGWTLSWAQAQNGPGQPYGREGVFVTSHYDGPDGAPAMSTVVELIARRPANIIPTTGISGGGIFETRVIDGHTALLYHNPSGASYNPAGYRHYWTFVMIFDATTSIGYNVSVYVPTFTELDAVIAIARSLYR